MLLPVTSSLTAPTPAQRRATTGRLAWSLLAAFACLLPSVQSAAQPAMTVRDRPNATPAPPAGPRALDQTTSVRALLTAARHGDTAWLRQLLDAGVDVNGRDPRFRQTALIRAAMFGQAASAQLLLDAGADPALTAAPEGLAAMHWAASLGDDAIVRHLLETGVAPDGADALDRTPLDHAVAVGAESVVRTLLAAGAAPERMRVPVSGYIGRALDPTTPGQLEALLALIAAGRGLEIDGGFADEPTALLALARVANRPGAERVAAALLAAGANREATRRDGRTALAVVEQWIPTQRDPRFRRTLELVAETLRAADASLRHRGTPP